MLSFSSLSTGYRQGKAWRIIGHRLQGALQHGELVALLGRNGCGKSTLLRTLSALQVPVEGDIRIDEIPLSGLSHAQLARLLSVVLTTKPEVPYLTAFETVAIGRMPYTDFLGSLRDDDKRIVTACLELTGADTLATQHLSDLSDGERQRVMIAKALAQQTPYIFLDEPTAFLDFPGKVQLLQLLAQLAKQEQKGILCSTHDVELALRIAHKLWLLTNDGLHIGTPAELADNGSLSRYFNDEGLHFDPSSMTFQLETLSNA